ncbi:ABC transporter permease [Paenibacillus sp. Marseille-P2973]|uniref:ABC transporter permease n=1 Tax=Paenibacillus sp. Marseille-P2973 TaxID=1871032 RepID=UPI001B35FC93|nr:ABC transporter permease [Paenibacillus sp. Marseille-P2973]MBQ4900816.1 ABC transporter permease [Paenibacillus sp. Marseille-P2973]
MFRITAEMNVRRLLLRRWADHWGKQMAILRYTFDGIVLLYLGIPGLLLLGRGYFGLWREELPLWLQSLPLTALSGLLLILIYAFGGLVLYIEAADVLFLKQRPRWLKGMMIGGALSSMLGSFTAIGACFVLIAPLLSRVYDMGLPGILVLLAVTCGFKTVHLLLSNLINVRWSGWRQMVLKSIAFSMLGGSFTLWMLRGMGSPAATAATLILCISLALLLAWIRFFRLRGRFDAEIREDERQKTSLTGMLLSGAVDRPPAVRTRPWLFRRGGRLLRSSKPEDRIAETAFKSFFRGPEIKLYGQFTFFGCIAVYFPAYPVNLIVYAALLVLLVYWLNGHRRYFFTRDLMDILPVAEHTEYRCATQLMALLLYPAVVIITCVLGAALLQAWWGVLAGIPAGLLIARVAGTMWKLFPSGYRRRGSL